MGETFWELISKGDFTALNNSDNDHIQYRRQIGDPTEVYRTISHEPPFRVVVREKYVSSIIVERGTSCFEIFIMGETVCVSRPKSIEVPTDLAQYVWLIEKVGKEFTHLSERVDRCVEIIQKPDKYRLMTG